MWPMYHQIRNNPNIAKSGMTRIIYIIVHVEGIITIMEDRIFRERLIKNEAGMYAEKKTSLRRFSSLTGRMKFLISPLIFLKDYHSHSGMLVSWSGVSDH